MAHLFSRSASLRHLKFSVTRPARLVPILIITLILGVGLAATSTRPVSASIGSWAATTNYPTGIEGQSCVTSSGFVYCIGGFPHNGSPVTNATYFSTLSSTGVGFWSASTVYPTQVGSQSCVANLGFVYCFGGQTPNGDSNAVYFASLSSSGISPWSATTSYPIATWAQSCVVDSGFVYCVGGFGQATGASDAVYFASVTPSGIGSWSQTTNYPTTIRDQSCVANSGFIYCIGGYGITGAGMGNVPTDAVYFAPLSSNGVGSWSATTKYTGDFLDGSCVIASSFVYCIGNNSNAVNFASSSSSGVSVWSATTNYPITVFALSCVVGSSFVYCIGGSSGATFTSAVYFTNVVVEGATSTSVNCNPSSIADNQPSHCVATIADLSATPTSPTGTVTFSLATNSPGSFTPSNTCTVTSTGPSTAACAVNVTYPAPRPGIGGFAGSQTITATYSGDSTRHASSGSTTITVTLRATSTLVSCSKAKGGIGCNVAVTDTSPSTSVTPTGNVAMSTSGTGTLSGCSLSGTGSSATCTVTYTPGKGKTSTITITATYPGDVNHLGSSGSTTIRSP